MRSLQRSGSGCHGFDGRVGGAAQDAGAARALQIRGSSAPGRPRPVGICDCRRRPRRLAMNPTVGVMMAVLMGVKDHATLARAADLGVAMQLTNICRDVGEDARAGRLYLPRQLLRDYGIDPDAFMANPSPGPKLTAVLQHLLGEADRRYQQADSGIEKLPKTCRPGIRAARRLYAEIGHKLTAGGDDPITTRAIVTRRRKVGIVAGLFRGSEQLSDDLFAPCARENQFLLAAVPHTEEWQRPTQPRRFSPSASWMLDLFIVLGQRDQITTERQSTDHRGRI